ncbi:MAG: hypothetical protein ACI8W3_000059, partial [Myxococcota bacterium]
MAITKCIVLYARQGFIGSSFLRGASRNLWFFGGSGRGPGERTEHEIHTQKLREHLGVVWGAGVVDKVEGYAGSAVLGKFSADRLVALCPVAAKGYEARGRERVKDSIVCK